jgi:hypothetical protein
MKEGNECRRKGGTPFCILYTQIIGISRSPVKKNPSMDFDMEKV